MVSSTFMPSRPSSNSLGRLPEPMAIMRPSPASASAPFDVLDVDGHVVGALDGALDVLEGGVVAHEHVDLLVDLGLGDLRRGHLDLNSVVGGQRGGRTQGELDGVGVVGAVGAQVDLLVIALLDRDDVELVEDVALVGADQLVGGLREHGLLAQSGVDHGTRSLTGTEAREAVLLGGLLVGLLDYRVDVGSRNGDRSGELGVLHLRSDVQRSSSRTCPAYTWAPGPLWYLVLV